MQTILQVLSGDDSSEVIPPPKGRVATSWLIPVAILLGALLLLAFANRQMLVPRISVRTVPVAILEIAGDTASSGEAHTAASARVSVQAPGWVEPAPHPIYVTALADGVVEELLVLEGARVQPGQVVARLVKEDAQLELARAEAALARRRAFFVAAQTEWDEPVALERAVAVARASLEEARAQRLALEADVVKQGALLAEAQAVYESLRPLAGDAAPKVTVDTARLKRDAQKAAKSAMASRLDVGEAQIDRLEAELTAAERNLTLRVDSKRRLAETKAAVAEAEAHVEAARLRLARMEVVAPVGGTVMDRLVAPGAKVMLGMDGATSAHIVHLYDPEQLQVRVDVPLADAAKVRFGQRARIVVDVLPEREFSGHVTRFVHQADISKNTVQVKVAIDDPDAPVKPDMLARVKFLAQVDTQGTGGGVAGAGGLRVFVPPGALVDGASAIWVLNAEGERVQRRSIVMGRQRSKGWQEVLEGLHAGDVVVVSPPPELKDGRRVRIAAEEDKS